jgi:hypothetical protein
MYLKYIPPSIWACIWVELADGEAKESLKATLFDETEHLRDLAQPWIRSEVNYLISRHPEIDVVVRKFAKDYFIRNSWRKWLPWNWRK